MSRFELDQAALQRVLRSPNGPVARQIATRTLRVRNRAVELVPVDEGRLKQAIGWTLDPSRGGIRGRIYVRGVRYARAVHEGAAPHEIRPRTPGGVLRFRPSAGVRRRPGGRRMTPAQRRRGRVGPYVYARVVRHPGQRSIPFLRAALRAAR